MTQITYDITLDDSGEHMTKLVVTTLCASKVDGKSVPKEEALSTAPHIAFTATYTFSSLNEVERFAVPPAAAKCLK